MDEERGLTFGRIVWYTDNTMTSVHFRKEKDGEGNLSRTNYAYTVKKDGKYMSVGGRLTGNSEEAFLYAKRELCEELKKDLEENKGMANNNLEVVRLIVYTE